MNGNVLTCEGVEGHKSEEDRDKSVYGARYSHPLCPEFPHFEVNHLVPWNVKCFSPSKT